MWKSKFYLSRVVVLYEGGGYGMTEWVTSFGSHVLFNQKSQVHQLEGQNRWGYWHGTKNAIVIMGEWELWVEAEYS